jgi:cytohesin
LPPSKEISKLPKQAIDDGADVNARDLMSPTGKTILHSTAGLSGHNEIAELLIEKGADVNARDNRGVTPLHDAATFGRKETVELLSTA